MAEAREKNSIKQDSLTDRLREVEGAVWEKLGQQQQAEPVVSNDVWPIEVFDDFVIVESGRQRFFRVPYEMQDDEIVFAARDEWEEVEKVEEWIAKSLQIRARLSARNEAGKLAGSRVKLLGQTKDVYRVGGYGVVFGGRDLVGDYFTKDTDFWFDRVTETPMVLYDHGQDGMIKKVAIGRVNAKQVDDIGLWIEAQIDRYNVYAGAINELIDQEKLGWSSGAVAHLVEIKSDGCIKSWPVAEFSLTPTPAEPRTLGVSELRSLSEVDGSLKAVMPEGSLVESGPGAATVTVPEGSTITIETRYENGDITMGNEVEQAQGDVSAEAGVVAGNEVKPVIAAPAVPVAPDSSAELDGLKNQVADIAATVSGFDALKTTMDELSTGFNSVLEYMQNTPKLEGGYYTNTGGATDPEVKSFGDWLLAVRRNDVKRLTKVYKSTKDMTEGTGTQGGYLVPREFSDELLQITQANSPIAQRVRRIPVNSDAGDFPALDHFAAPTAGSGNTAMAAGVTAASVAEGGSITETQATLESISWKVNKVGGFTEVSNELIADSPQAIEALLTGLFSVAIGAKIEHYIVRGTGAGEPLGILNAACAIGITPASNNAFGEADALSMMSRFKPLGGAPAWLMHPGIIPDFNNFTASNVDMVDWTAALRGALLGYPIIYSEHLPQDDNAGGVILADLSAYLLFERMGLAIAFSEHAAFKTDKGTWRFLMRLDGQPWLSAAITLADPQGSYTVSPFVYHND